MLTIKIGEYIPRSHETMTIKHNCGGAGGTMVTIKLAITLREMSVLRLYGTLPL